MGVFIPISHIERQPSRGVKCIPLECGDYGWISSVTAAFLEWDRRAWLVFSMIPGKSARGPAQSKTLPRDFTRKTVRDVLKGVVCPLLLGARLSS